LNVDNGEKHGKKTRVLKCLNSQNLGFYSNINSNSDDIIEFFLLKRPTGVNFTNPKTQSSNVPPGVNVINALQLLLTQIPKAQKRQSSCQSLYAFGIFVHKS